MARTNVNHEVSRWLELFSAALERGDAKAASAMFENDGFLRDLLALTWTITTSEGRQEIRTTLAAAIESVHPRDFRLSPVTAGNPPAGHWTQAWIDFDTDAGPGRGYIRLRNGAAWTLLTELKELRGHEEQRGVSRPMGLPVGASKDTPTWTERRQAESQTLGYETHPYVLIVGGGQGGLAVAARLRQLNVPAIVVDRNERPGDSWRQRYKTLSLHDVVWYDHMPYVPFPDHWPVYTPKDKMADWLESYASVMEINYWGSTECMSATWDPATEKWAVLVLRDGQPIELHPKHLVIASGVSSKAVIPDIPGQADFAGSQHHSSAHPGPDEYAGKRVVVVGSNNSAHDISAALCSAGADVTMLQRSGTLIVTLEAMRELSQGPLYSENAVARGITTDLADLLFASIPNRLMPQFQAPRWVAIRERDAEFYSALEDAGFDVDFGVDDSGLWMMYITRGGGYYIDTGASQLIIDGEIHLRSGTEISHLTTDEVVLDSGEHLPADAIIYATGYGNMSQYVADLISPEVAERVGPVWGIGSGYPGDPGPWEGEPRNMWTPTAQPGLWFHGGNLHMSRHYSKYLALQLKARYEGVVPHGLSAAGARQAR